jgi:hypothetical protein
MIRIRTSSHEVVITRGDCSSSLSSLHQHLFTHFISDEGFTLLVEQQPSLHETQTTNTNKNEGAAMGMQFY